MPLGASSGDKELASAAGASNARRRPPTRRNDRRPRDLRLRLRFRGWLRLRGLAGGRLSASRLGCHCRLPGRLFAATRSPLGRSCPFLAGCFGRLRASLGTPGPEQVIKREPFQGGAQGRCLEPAIDHTADLLPRDEPCLGEHTDMLEHRRKRHRKWRRQIRDRKAVGVGKSLDDGPSRGIGERCERPIQCRCTRHDQPTHIFLEVQPAQPVKWPHARRWRQRWRPSATRHRGAEARPSCRPTR